MPEKGNGLDRTNELLTQVLGELGGIKKELVQVNARLDRVESEIRDMKGEIHDMKADIRQLNVNMTQIAKFVGEELSEIKRRVDVLERRAA